ncbi:MAG: hypothetical protein JWN01_1215 [Patescibacteria group bacterium]|nr:hypothetical protein [Patescibacteria group bacterium]
MRHLGAVAVAVLTAGLGFVIWKWPAGTDLTFSQRVARHKTAIAFYIALFTVALPLLTIFFVGWFAPALHLSKWFMGLILTSVIAQYSVTLVPEVGGWKTRYHRATSFVSAACLVPALILAAMSGYVNLSGRLMALTSLAVMLGIMYIITLNKGRHRYLLWLQTGYYVAFFATTLWMAR